MFSRNAILAISQASPRVLEEWDDMFLVYGWRLEVISHIDCWAQFKRPAQEVSFLLDAMSVDLQPLIERLAVALHSQRPAPNGLIVVPGSDPHGFIPRFEDSHLWIHRHLVDDWREGVAHLIGQRYGLHVHAA